MRTIVCLISFALGVVLAQWVPQLPSPWFSGMLLIATTVFLLQQLLRTQPFRLVWIMLAALLFACAYTWLRADWRMADELPPRWEKRDIEIIGIIDDLPQTDEQSVRFSFAVESILTPKARVPARIALNWYRARGGELTGKPLPSLHAGERWQLTVRLKRPHGYSNPHGFDAEAWLLENNLRATGSVRNDEPNRRIATNGGRIIDHVNRWRDALRERMRAILTDRRYAGVLIALAVGDQRAINNADWTLFNITSVSHLLSISGGHVTLFATWIAALTFSIWRRSPRLISRLPAQLAAAWAAVTVAFAYAFMAGFEVPAQRTCYMLLVAFIALCLRRSLSPWLIITWSLVVVLIIDPWATLAIGFWFSFFAVVALVFTSIGRIGERSWWKLALMAQLAVTLVLAPISVALFQQVSLVGPLANAVAIPLIGLIVTPLTLIWTVLPVDTLLLFAHQIIAWLALWLQWLASSPLALWTQAAPPWWSVPAALLGCFWLMAPRAWPQRWLGAVWCAPLLLAMPQWPAAGEFSITMLDVGQGSAAVIQTTGHTLLYDTGPDWNNSGSDAGSRLIAPYLRAMGSDRLHGMVISHIDIDHSGGALSLLSSQPTGWLLTSANDDSPPVIAATERDIATHTCIDKQSWQWDGVRFDVLHPTTTRYEDPRSKTNDLSCVILVSTPSMRVLLTGDIGATSELSLIERYGDTLRADVLLVPHHGSKTSSTARLLDTVKPSIALINTGYKNRFGHPHAGVLKRYAERDIKVFRSDLSGAVRIDSAQGPTQVTQNRIDQRRYWTDLPQSEHTEYIKTLWDKFFQNTETTH